MTDCPRCDNERFLTCSCQGQGCLLCTGAGRVPCPVCQFCADCGRRLQLDEHEVCRECAREREESPLILEDLE